ncbi:MAG: peroxiredoxin family protein [Bacteroidia bacterium]|jgi:peroxiredoxin|nr:peroxiredoxin family protein [Bacteroidia bacterium]
MHPRPYFTWTSLVLAPAALVMAWAGVPAYVAALAACVAYFITAKDFSKFTGPIQVFSLLLSAIVLGVILGEKQVWNMIFLGGAMLFAGLATYGRMIFFKVFRYVNHLWLEPLLLIFSLAFFAAGVWQGYTWYTFVFTVPVLVFALVIFRGIVKDSRQLKPTHLKAYQVAVNSEAPEFELADENGNKVRLSDFRGNRHLLLVFVRGDWCPGCHIMLRAYQREAERLKQKNIHVLSIGPDPTGVNKEMVQRLGLSFNVLADEGQRTAMRYGVQLQEYANEFAEKYEEGIPLPASFLIDKNGKVRYVSRPDRVGEFLNPELIFPIIDQLDSASSL